MIEDELLKWKFKAGGKDALRRIYEKYRDYLLTLAIALLNDAGLAEDIVHDVFVAFAQSSGTFKLRGSLKSYLATCTLNRCRDQIRARKRQPLSLDEDTLMQSDFDPPDKRMISDEQSRQVAGAMAQLPYEQREAVIMHVQGGLRFKVIARLQDVSLNTIQSRYRYGLDKLRSILDGEVER